MGGGGELMGRTVLHVAALWGDIDVMRACLRMGAYVDTVDAKRDVTYDLVQGVGT